MKQINVIFLIVVVSLWFNQGMAAQDDASVKHLTLDELHHNPSMYEHQVIQTRGFAYLSEQNEIILAAQPDLKSCCLNTSTNYPVIVETNSKEFPTDGRAITLQGTIVVKLRQHTTITAPILTLLNPIIIEETSSFPALLLYVSIFVILTWGIYRWMCVRHIRF